MEINWLELWRDLILANPHTPESEPMKRYRVHAYQGEQRPDPLLDFVLQSVDRNVTVLDIGAGSGRWTVPLARVAKSVTAVEPSAEMTAILKENLKNVRADIDVIQAAWEEACVVDHDIIVCAHAMYSSPDLALFVRKMESHSRIACFLEVRLPPVDGVLGILSKAISGRIFDSANAIVAYNALYTMGIYASVLVEKDIYHWVNNSLEEAFIRAKKHLHLEATTAYDELIKKTLKSRLVFSDNCYVWPDGMRSALIWWNPSVSRK